MSKIVGCWCPKVQMSSTRLQQADSIAHDTKKVSKLRSFGVCYHKSKPRVCRNAMLTSLIL